MHKDLVARAAITVNAAGEKVWHALVTPDAIKQYMFGTNVASDWQEGSAITWEGVWQGKSYKDKGAILKVRPRRILQYSHFSPLSGLPDEPNNYHIVTIELSPHGSQTEVSLSQDNNATEEARAHSEKNWAMMLAQLKHFLEK
jgi:uncharacterized protein YndB with AHSA1/START domain